MRSMSKQVLPEDTSRILSRWDKGDEVVIPNLVQLNPHRDWEAVVVAMELTKLAPKLPDANTPRKVYLQWGRREIQQILDRGDSPVTILELDSQLEAAQTIAFRLIRDGYEQFVNLYLNSLEKDGHGKKVSDYPEPFTKNAPLPSH